MAITKVTATLEAETSALQAAEGVYEGDLAAPKKSGDYAVEVAAYDSAGNVTLDNRTVEVSLWHAPKTDWKPTDRFNFVDYNRIKNNLVYLHELAEALYKPFSMEDTGADIEFYAAYWDVNKFNMFERNLEKINQNIFTQNYGYSQTFFENGPFIKWNELNRIESAIFSMNDILERQKAGLRRLSFRFGAFKGVNI